LTIGGESLSSVSTIFESPLVHSAIPSDGQQAVPACSAASFGTKRRIVLFYALNPKIASTACGQWWRAHTYKLLAAGRSWEAISAGLLVIEWFPYHSKRSALPVKPVCPSQQYSFQLAKEMLEGKIVVGMRSKKHWLNVVPTVQNVPFLKNPQNPHISPANTGAELFDRIVEALRENCPQPS
jgi:hypothetical protein